MDEQRKTELRNELTRFASRYWAGEAEVAHAFFSVPRTDAEHLRWLGLQAYKELQPRTDGIIIKLIQKLTADYGKLEHGVDRHDMLHTTQFLEEEFRHYVLFADVIDHITGKQVTMAEVVKYELPGETDLRAVRKGFADKHGELAKFASSFCEGGGASIYYEGMLMTGSPLAEYVAHACKGVYEDEVDHAVHGASDLAGAADTEEDWALAKEIVAAISEQRVRMRNEQFGFPMSDARFDEMVAGTIEIPERYAAMLV
jgi:hypothetical protein